MSSSALSLSYHNNPNNSNNPYIYTSPPPSSNPNNLSTDPLSVPLNNLGHVKSHEESHEDSRDNTRSRDDEADIDSRRKRERERGRESVGMWASPSDDRSDRVMGDMGDEVDVRHKVYSETKTQSHRILDALSAADDTPQLTGQTVIRGLSEGY